MSDNPRPRTKERDIEPFLRRVAEFSAYLGAEWYEVDDVPDVLFNEQRLFGGRRPIDMLRTEEGFDELMCNFDSVASGSFL